MLLGSAMTSSPDLPIGRSSRALQKKKRKERNKSRNFPRIKKRRSARQKIDDDRKLEKREQDLRRAEIRTGQSFSLSSLSPLLSLFHRFVRKPPPSFKSPNAAGGTAHGLHKLSYTRFDRRVEIRTPQLPLSRFASFEAYSVAPASTQTLYEKRVSARNRFKEKQVRLHSKKKKRERKREKSRSGDHVVSF